MEKIWLLFKIYSKNMPLLRQMSIPTKIGKSNFFFKISPLDCDHLEISWSCAFPDPRGATFKGQRRWSWVLRVRICAPNVHAMTKKNLDFSHPIIVPCLIYSAPYFRLILPPLKVITRVKWISKVLDSHCRGSVRVSNWGVKSAE